MSIDESSVMLRASTSVNAVYSDVDLELVTSRFWTVCWVGWPGRGHCVRVPASMRSIEQKVESGLA